MRRTAEALRQFEVSIKTYLSELEKLEWEQLLYKANPEEWSIGQMYVHLIQSAQGMQLRNADLCLAGSEENLSANGEKTESGKAVFDQGSFPPVRVRVPASPQYTPKQPESRDRLIEGLHAVAERMRGMEPALAQASERNKVLHPRLGALNAKEWFLLVEMHYRHHFLQLDRLKSELPSSSN
ncbi:DinB family protein [Cohnella thailandensis]|uniref:DinB family protein n=1 Tax=Cohnella thailandensis TaxID=557557 RepID=A0A841T4F2_9BACL|nr:DinB family protein [Cohnella thailandensis]MBB6637505.1 DinB family protein [Cohnella thailandensis]MBP1977538.1 hypothetical protein [Cohnella thailandensis]